MRGQNLPQGSAPHCDCYGLCLHFPVCVLVALEPGQRSHPGPPFPAVDPVPSPPVLASSRTERDMEAPTALHAGVDGTQCRWGR